MSTTGTFELDRLDVSRLSRPTDVLALPVLASVISDAAATRTTRVLHKCWRAGANVG
jgi:hypothetical protein